MAIQPLVMGIHLGCTVIGFSSHRHPSHYRGCQGTWVVAEQMEVDYGRVWFTDWRSKPGSSLGFLWQQEWKVWELNSTCHGSLQNSPNKHHRSSTVTIFIMEP